MYLYLTKLSDDTEQVSGDLGMLNDPDALYGRAFSTAQAHMNSIMGDYIHCDLTSGTDVKRYLKQIYRGESTVPVVDPNGRDAQFQLELDIDTK